MSSSAVENPSSFAAPSFTNVNLPFASITVMASFTFETMACSSACAKVTARANLPRVGALAPGFFGTLGSTDLSAQPPEPVALRAVLHHQAEDDGLRLRQRGAEPAAPVGGDGLAVDEQLRSERRDTRGLRAVGLVSVARRAQLQRRERVVEDDV